jgi:hypothetical protein
MSDLQHIYGGVVIIIFVICDFSISLAQLIVGGIYFGQCPANGMMSIFSIVSGVIGIVAEVLLIIVAILLIMDDFEWEPRNISIGVVLIIIYCFLVPWYMYGGSLTSVDTTAKFRQSTNPNITSTYCAQPVQEIIDAAVIMFWGPIIFLLLVLFCVIWCNTLK